MTPQIVICESSQRWTIALRWALSNSKIQVDNEASVQPCFENLARNPFSVVGIEVALFGIEVAVRTIRDLRESFPDCAIITLGERADAQSEALFREAGATHVVLSRRDLRSTARLVARFISQGKQVPASYREEVWSRMPWHDQAVTHLN